jgi:hypothetical protein
MRQLRVSMLAVAGATLLAAVAGPQAPPTTAPPGPPPAIEKKQPDVPYVPTDERVVSTMLRLAGVGRGDVLYDLGSGDGRIVITAAKHFGARGVGVELDPDLVREAQDNARQAGVADQVRFLQQDLFDADIREATVVTLYLLQEVNLKLRPKLLRELRPGTRVVSHNYDMGDWMPQRTLEIKLPDGANHEVHLWVVPPLAARQ